MRMLPPCTPHIWLLARPINTKDHTILHTGMSMISGLADVHGLEKFMHMEQKPSLQETPLILLHR